MSNSNIVVEITDATEFHCFRLVVNPRGHAAWCLQFADIMSSPAFTPRPAPQACTCGAEGQGARLEIMLHGRSVVDLIHKLSLALCDWQAQTTQYLIERSTQYLIERLKREAS